MKFICPLIIVADIQRSREFYERILNQTVKYDFGENITFHGDFAIHLQSHFSQLIDKRPIQPGSNNYELYFEEDDLLPLVQKLKLHGVEFVHDLREQPWRQRVVRFYDPDQHIIEVGESMEHLCFRLHKEGKSNDEIAQISHMPEVFVKEAIDHYLKSSHK